MDASDEELAALDAMVREHLAWEERLGGGVVPEAAFEVGAAAGEVSGATGGDVPARSEDAAVTATVSLPAPMSVPASVSVVPAAERGRRLEVLAAEVAACTRCGLHAGRTRTVFSRGAYETPIAFVGEGPGYHEDQAGLPFVGAAGELLDKMVAAMGFERDEVYVCNVVKCRPPENRTPRPDEAAACEPFLSSQLEIVAPRVIVALGRCAAESLGCAEPGRSWRGAWGSWRGIPVMPTYHPAYLLRSPEMKRPVWEDLQKVLARIGRTAPPPGGSPPSRRG